MKKSNQSADDDDAPLSVTGILMGGAASTAASDLPCRIMTMFSYYLFF